MDRPIAPELGEDALDEGLEILAGYGPEYSGGLSNHGPMGADALVRLGRGDAVPTWAEQYRRILEPGSAAGAVIDSSEWREVLGVTRRFGDWQATFGHELATSPWPEALGRWLPRLVPGVMAAGTHGVIRVAHAAGALERRETPPRLGELANGLAYWASRYVTLGREPQLHGEGSPSVILDGLPRHEPPESAWLIWQAALAAAEHEDVHAAIDSAKRPTDVEDAIDDLIAATLRLYVNNRRYAPIGYVHLVTAPVTLRDLLPYVPQHLHQAAFAYLWQTCATVHSAWRASAPAPPLSDQALEDQDLADRAVASADEHAIKFTLACLRQHNRRPDPLLLGAAADASHRLRR